MMITRHYNGVKVSRPRNSRRTRCVRGPTSIAAPSPSCPRTKWSHSLANAGDDLPPWQSDSLRWLAVDMMLLSPLEDGSHDTGHGEQDAARVEGQLAGADVGGVGGGVG